MAVRVAADRSVKAMAHKRRPTYVGLQLLT
jgi:hypothetical protein